MTRVYAAIGLLLALLAVGWWGQVQRGRAVQAEAALAGAQAQLAQVQEVVAVMRGHVARMEREKAQYDSDLLFINQLEGGDAPLSDFMRGVDGRLR